MEGDNSHVEMKLSSDMDEEVGGNGVGEHLNHGSARKLYVTQKVGLTPKNLCFMAAAILLIFIIGKKGSVNEEGVFIYNYCINIMCGLPQGSISVRTTTLLCCYECFNELAWCLSPTMLTTHSCMYLFLLMCACVSLILNHCFFKDTWLATWSIKRRTWLPAL